MGLVNDHLLYGAPVPQAEEACVETFYRLSVLHPNDEDFVNFQEVVVHFVGGFPVYGKGCAGVKYDLELAVVDMIANPKGSRLEGLVMHKAELTASIDHKTDIHDQTISCPNGLSFKDLFSKIPNLCRTVRGPLRDYYTRQTLILDE